MHGKNCIIKIKSKLIWEIIITIYSFYKLINIKIKKPSYVFFSHFFYLNQYFFKNFFINKYKIKTIYKIIFLRKLLKIDLAKNI